MKIEVVKSEDNEDEVESIIDEPTLEVPRTIQTRQRTRNAQHLHSKEQLLQEIVDEAFFAGKGKITSRQKSEGNSGVASVVKVGRPSRNAKTHAR